MKLILAIIRDHDADPVTHALTEARFRITRISSTGGLLRRGVTTLMIGVDDGQVDAAIQVLRESTAPAAAEEKRATVFVVNVENFVQV